LFAFPWNAIPHGLQYTMKATDYDRIAEVLGISASEAHELDIEQRRWHEFIANKTDRAAMAAASSLVMAAQHE
jgi:hypothetical protein